MQLTYLQWVIQWSLVYSQMRVVQPSPLILEHVHHLKERCCLLALISELLPHSLPTTNLLSISVDFLVPDVSYE